MSSSLNVVVLVGGQGGCEQPHFRLYFQRFTPGSTLCAGAPENREPPPTTFGQARGLWMSAGLFETCPQRCALTGSAAVCGAGKPGDGRDLLSP
ncbi:MAG: hypothetical protein CFE44_22510 [Burkholderiales bacterium PBB4]|nr:MAG: hypothetical protein CFE44_22510 [Burkholderiales bacterium PBB4]